MFVKLQIENEMVERGLREHLKFYFMYLLIISNQIL